MILAQVGLIGGFLLGEILWSIDDRDRLEIKVSHRILMLVAMSGIVWLMNLRDVTGIVISFTIGTIARQSIEDIEIKRVYKIPCWIVAMLNIIYGTIEYGYMPIAICVALATYVMAKSKFLGKPDAYCYMAVLFMCSNTRYQIMTIVVSSAMVVVASLMKKRITKEKLVELKIAFLPIILTSSIFSYVMVVMLGY